MSTNNNTNNNNNNNNQQNNNARADYSVRGPTSALSSFLREQGIRIPNQSRRARREANATTATASTSTAAATQGTSVVEGPSTAESSTSQTQLTEQASSSTVSLRLGTRGRLASAVAKKRKKKGSDDDDSDFEDDVFFPSASKPKPNTRAHVVFCKSCHRRFTRKVGQPELEECPSCLSGESSSTKPPAKRKRVITRINKTVNDDKKMKIASLSDLCINVIAANIDDVESFGFISEDSLNKLAKIISRNRKLSNDIARLFMESDTRRLHLYDCTEMTDVALLNVAQFCSRLQDLSLSYCGHMNDAVIEGYALRFSDLKKLHLSGPYLVTKKAWIDFFKKIGKRIESFELRYTSRFDLDCLKALVQNCPNLTNLKFGHVTTIDSSWLGPISKLKKLTSLELAWPETEDAFKTDEVVKYLSKAGSSLEQLSLKGGANLEDTLFTGLNHCQKLRVLHMEQASKLTAEAMVEFLQKWKNPGLVELDISRCILFDDEVLKEIISHSGTTLTKLNLHSLHLITISGLEYMAGSNKESIVCKQLKEINCSFIRSIDDYVLGKMIKECTLLDKIEVWGCPLVTDTAKSKEGLVIAGRELLDIPV